MVMSPSFTKLILVLSFNFCLIGSGPSLIEIGESTLHTLLEVCLARKDKVEIKCMGSIGGKTPIESNLQLFFSSLRHNEQDEVDVVCFVQLCHG
jgi:hypothetical protein